MFPFTYNGVSYTTCTSDVVPWCAFDAVVHSPLDATRWGNCPTTPDPTDAPSELDQGSCEPSPGFTDAPWYADYSSHVRMVRPPDAHTHSEFMSDACARWWHPSPQRSYEDYSLRPWSGILRSRTMETKWRPRCSFGQALLKETKCASSQRQLIAALDAARVVYFPRSGTELGIVRGSQYLSEDGDLDIYVDMPQTMLYDKLQSELSPPPYLSGSGVTAEVQWAVPNCPEVHLVYNDWISDELQHRAKPSDLCLCRLNSVELLCHKDGAKRMYTQYGPSWIVPLGVKAIDMPHWAIRNQKDGDVKAMRSKLSGMANRLSGMIEANAVQALMPAAENFAPVLDQAAFGRLVRMSSDVFDALRQHHVSYIAGGGTLIGAVRHGGLIPWDDDVDLYYEWNTESKHIFETLVMPSLRKRGWTTQWDTDGMSWYVCDGPTKSVCVAAMAWCQSDGTVTYRCFSEVKYHQEASRLFPLQWVQWHSTTVSIPSDPASFWEDVGVGDQREGALTKGDMWSTVLAYAAIKEEGHHSAQWKRTEEKRRVEAIPFLKSYDPVRWMTTLPWPMVDAVDPLILAQLNILLTDSERSYYQI